jgi:predicted AlkP superfamily phosphohydrolase/phosphomutase
LVLKDGKKPNQDIREGLTDVDWSRTHAYATGLGGIYLNLKGREREGILEEGTEAERVRNAIQSGMRKMVDSAQDRPAVSSVSRREEIYSGPYIGDAPDLLVNFCPGYRVSWQSAVGGFANSLIEDNMRKWSGDHIVDPESVPGILFMNQKTHPVAPKPRATRMGHSNGDVPNIIDLAPTILNYLGVPVPKIMEGTSLL